jgi:hypothetical protein
MAVDTEGRNPRENTSFRPDHSDLDATELKQLIAFHSGEMEVPYETTPTGSLLLIQLLPPHIDNLDQCDFGARLITADGLVVNVIVQGWMNNVFDASGGLDLDALLNVEQERVVLIDDHSIYYEDYEQFDKEDLRALLNLHQLVLKTTDLKTLDPDSALSEEHRLDEQCMALEDLLADSPESQKSVPQTEV